jgi:hypothetical protein
MKQPLSSMRAYRYLDVRVRLYDGGYRWNVLEDDGRLIETGLPSYDTEIKARRAGNAAARAIRKQID